MVLPYFSAWGKADGAFQNLHFGDEKRVTCLFNNTQLIFPFQLLTEMKTFGHLLDLY